MHLILTGATGHVGSGVLDAMMKMTDITRISVLSRRPVKFAEDTKDPRVHVIVNNNFENYDPEIINQLRGATGCVWALGVSQTQVGKEEYVRITKTFALESAKTFQALPVNNEPFNFVYVSGNGATTKPTSRSVIFARVKGETELALAEMRKQNPSLHALSVRPAIVDSSAHNAIQPYVPEPSFPIKAARFVLSPIARTWFPSHTSPTEPLGRFLAEAAMGRHREHFKPGPGIEMIGDFPILENSVFRKLAGLK
ncbi:unnamed protein product [Clonostachys rosea f. rosea IK726]|uniref:NAD(P)-binding domain-containing protein n=2 Tax=Bionectria ochroleuca TaxID=29856 RepID=A0A0B7JR85_BIOOC|nr:unnamed protein product [Clonostachys rosea f. rosea IK726]